MNLTILTERYVCAECHSPLTLRYDAEADERWQAVCTVDAAHRGFNTKATVEIQAEQARREALRIIHDPELRKALPWLPEPEHKTLDEAMTDLYDDDPRDEALPAQAEESLNARLAHKAGRAFKPGTPEKPTARKTLFRKRL